MYPCTLDLVNNCGSGFVAPLHSSGNPGLEHMVFAMAVYRMLSASNGYPSRAN